jgi:hypothetical protein
VDDTTRYLIKSTLTNWKFWALALSYGAFVTVVTYLILTGV